MRCSGLVVLGALAAAVAGLCTGVAHADAPMPLAFGNVGSPPQAPWHVAGLPHQTKPFTTFSVVDLDGHRAVKIEADSSFGNLVYPVQMPQPAFSLAWQWRVESLVDAVDLHQKQGDDTAVKVCVSFDLPLDRVPFVERQLIKVARGQTDEPVPGATICYVWDPHLPVGTSINSPFTGRLRYKVLESGSSRLHQWTAEKRNVAADFTELFGKESLDVPPVIGIAVGADADNTHGHSVAHVADVVIER